MDNDKREEQIKKLVEFTRSSGKINRKLYVEYDVKMGLRDSAGKGVLTGLTEISDVVGVQADDRGHPVPVDGKLFYRGYDVLDLINGFADKRYGFEEVIYLLLFGKLPNHEELEDFIELLVSFRALPEKFTRDVIMKAPSANLMNALQKSILTLYSYDENPEDIGLENSLRQSLSLISKLPLIAVYSYRTYRHYHKGDNLHIRNPKPKLSLAENLLQMLHSNGKFTELEAKVLDIMLVLHADHGGGNNSTFTTHVVSSTGTDSYSSVSASLASLKGFKHGGANIKVQSMFDDIESNVRNWEDEDQIRDYLLKILNKEAFDGAGLIYGIGHAVYSLSDPRAVILKKFAKKLSEAKGKEDEFALYERVENIGKEILMQGKDLNKPMCANVDFYSGFVYSLLGIPKELYTPLFAISRISGWSAHRMEELINGRKIIRPAYKYVGKHEEYIERDKRS